MATETTGVARSTAGVSRRVLLRITLVGVASGLSGCAARAVGDGLRVAADSPTRAAPTPTAEAPTETPTTSPPTPTPEATPIPTLEPLNEDELISEWQQSGYVDLQGLDPSEAMRRLDILQDGHENEGRVLVLPDQYRVLLMGVRLADVYEVHTRLGREVKGLNLRTMELEIFEGEKRLIWYPGNGPDIEKGDGIIVHQSELVDEQTGTKLTLLSEKGIYFNFEKVDDDGKPVVERRRVVVNWGTIPLLNKDLFFSTLFMVFPNLKGKHVKLVVQNEVFNPNMPQPAGFKKGIDFNLAVSFLDPVDGVNGDTVYLGRTRTIDRLTQGQDVGSDEGEAVLFPLYQLLRAVNKQNPGSAIDNNRTELSVQAQLMAVAEFIVPDGPATMIDFTPVGSEDG